MMVDMQPNQTNHMYYLSLSVYIYKEDLALNNLYCHKPNQGSMLAFVNPLIC